MVRPFRKYLQWYTLTLASNQGILNYRFVERVMNDGQQTGASHAGSYSFDPTSIPDVIVSHKRKRAHIERLRRQREGAPRRAQDEQSLCLATGLMAAIQRDVIRRFLDEAKLSESLRADRQRIRESPGTRQDLQWAGFEFYLACKPELQLAVGQYADQLTQALIVRIGSKNLSSKLREQLWAECLRFADSIIREGLALQWVDKAWGTDRRERPIPLPTGSTYRAMQEVTADFAKVFKEIFLGRLMRALPEFLTEIDAKIALRCDLTPASTRRPREIRRSIEGPLNAILVAGAFNTGDPELDRLLRQARDRFVDPDLEVRRDAVEKLWDAWERMKTLQDQDKRRSIQALLQAAVPDEAFRELLNTEGRSLTEVGNTFMIRHMEVGKDPITESDYVDYLFHRMYALIWLLLRRTGRL